MHPECASPALSSISASLIFAQISHIRTLHLCGDTDATHNNLGRMLSRFFSVPSPVNLISVLAQLCNSLVSLRA